MMKTNSRISVVNEVVSTGYSKIRKRAAALMGVAIAGVMFNAQAGTCVINVTANQQAIDGFGFSSAWCGDLSSAKNVALYDTLGFSLLRIRIDQNNSWSDETANASAAHSRGLKVLGCPWYIPDAYRSGNTLAASQYGNYSTWLANAANSIGLDYVSLKNEPDGSGTDGTLTGTQIHDLLANWTIIGHSIAMADAIGFTDSLTDPALNDSATASRVTIVSGHIYGGGLNVHQNALNHGKHVWMTEHYVANTQTSMANCIAIAKEVSDCMNDQMSAYFWWWVNDSDTSVNLVNTSGTIYKNGYTLGQFAKWIRPGKQCCSATYNPASNVYTTAYHGGGIVIVAVNTGTSAVSQPFMIQNATGVTSFLVNRTSSSENMASVISATVSNNTFTYVLPAQSVTTFHQF